MKIFTKSPSERQHRQAVVEMAGRKHLYKFCIYKRNEGWGG